MTKRKLIKSQESSMYTLLNEKPYSCIESRVFPDKDRVRDRHFPFFTNTFVHTPKGQGWYPKKYIML